MKLITTHFDRPDVRMDAYLHEDDTRRPMLLVFPGGGYNSHAPHEAEPVALHWYARGYNACILYYTVACPCAADLALRDAARAIALIREKAEEWHTGKIACIGFSAGGHLCANLSNAACDPALQQELGLTMEQMRPDLSILIYALLDTKMLYDQRGLRDDDKAKLRYLSTTEPTDADFIRTSPIYHVTEQTPPAFLSHAVADTVVDIRNSLNYAKALADCGAKFEMHITQEGWHGYAMCLPRAEDKPARVHCALWVEACERWLQTWFGI